MAKPLPTIPAERPSRLRPIGRTTLKPRNPSAVNRVAGRFEELSISYLHCTASAPLARASRTSPMRLLETVESASITRAASMPCEAAYSKPKARAEPLPRACGSLQMTTSAPAFAARSVVRSEQLWATTMIRVSVPAAETRRLSTQDAIKTSSLCAGMITARRIGADVSGATALAFRQARGERENCQFYNQRQCEQQESNSQSFREVGRHEHKLRTKVCGIEDVSVLLNFWCGGDQKRLWWIGRGTRFSCTSPSAIPPGYERWGNGD